MADQFITKSSNIIHYILLYNLAITYKYKVIKNKSYNN